MQNEGMDERPYFIIYEVNTIILHFAFCILHSGNSPVNYNLTSGITWWKDGIFFVKFTKYVAILLVK